MKRLLVFGCVALAAGVVTADVWSDAMARFRYGEDTNGNGLFDEGEWIDELHGTDPTHVNHKTKLTLARSTDAALKDDVYFTNLTVECVLEGVQRANQRCIYLAQPIKVTGTTTNYLGQQLTLPFRPTGTNYSAVIRFRRDDNPVSYDAQGKKTSYDTWLFHFGYDWNGSDSKGTGLMVGVSPGGYLTLLAGRTQTSFTDTAKYKPCALNEWTDMIVLVSNHVVRVGFAPYAQPIRWMTNTFDNAVSMLPYKAAAIGGQNAYGAAASGNGLKRLKGAIHLFGMWDRCLSEREAMQALSGNQPCVFSAGVDGCNPARCGGGAAAGSVTVDLAAQDVRTYPSAVAAGGTVNLSFVVQPRLAKAGEYFYFRPTATSAGTLDVSVDGQALDRMTIAGGKTERLFVRGKYLTAGAHTLSLSNVGSTTLAWEKLELTGSWGVDKVDKAAQSESWGNADIYLESLHVNDFRRVLAVKTTPECSVKNAPGRPTTLHWNVTEEDLGQSEYEFRVQFGALGKNSGDWLYDIPLVCSLNGNVISSNAQIFANMAITNRISASDLHLGDNTLKLELLGTYPDYRYYYVTSYLMDLQRPHTGMAIIFR